MTPVRIMAAAVSIACLAPVTPALATVASAVQTVQGIGACSRFGINVTQQSQSNPTPGASFTLTDNNLQTIIGTVSNDGQRLSWTSTEPVNFVIVGGTTTEGGPRSNVYFFGDGVVEDSGESAPLSAQIQQIRFCYGADTDGVTEDLPPCSSLENGPMCPVVDGDEGQEEKNGTIVFFDFDEPFFGIDSRENQCTCGNVQLDDCAESLPSDSEGTCAGGELLELPVFVEGIKNSRDGGPGATTVCVTVDGKRECTTK